MQPFQYKLRIMAKCFYGQLKAPFILGCDFFSSTINSTQFNFAFNFKSEKNSKPCNTTRTFIALLGGWTKKKIGCSK